jgi:predicted DNA-binding transcriptional regulator YafY
MPNSKQFRIYDPDGDRDAILQMLLQNPCSISDLVKETGRSRRTVEKRLQELREQFPGNIENVPRPIGSKALYYQIKDLRTIPPMPIKFRRDEIIGLAMLEQAADWLLGSKYAEVIRPCLEKIRRFATDKYGDQLVETIHTRVRIAGSLNRPVYPDEGGLDTIIQAMANEKQIRFEYHSGSGKTGARTASPLALLNVDREWSMIALEHAPTKQTHPRTYLLARAGRFKSIDQPAKGIRDFDIDKYLQNSVGGDQSSNSNPSPTFIVRYQTSGKKGPGEVHTWTKKDESKHDANGRRVVRFKTSAEYRVIREVLAWGGECEIVQPADVRAKIAEHAQRILKLHSNQAVNDGELFSHDKSAPSLINPARHKATKKKRH